MDLAQYAAFIGVALLVICTPGQDTALTIRNTLAGGRPAGVATALGVSAGQAVWTIATSAGLAVLLVASGPAFAAIRLAGAAYLIYLGVRSLWRAWRGPHLAAEDAGPRRILGPRSAAAQGFVSNLSNAKMVAFFVSLLPQFAGPHAGFVELLALGLNFCVMTLAWLCLYALAVERMAPLLRLAGVRRGIDAALGAVLTGLGVKLTAEAIG